MGIEKKLFEASLVLILFTTLVSSSQEQNNKELIATHVLSTKGNRIEMNPRLVLEITVHGFLLWASMGFLMPFGILAIRHGNREQNPKRLRIIFYLHAILEMLAIVIATAGAIMSIKNFNNLFNNNHQRLGVALYAVIWLQLVLGIFRPQRGSKRRRVWFLAHWIVGTSVSLLVVEIMSYFSDKIYDGEKFGFDGEHLHYVGGETFIMDYCDEDIWKTEEALRILQTDKDVMEMAKIRLRDNIVELFVVHKDGTTARKVCTSEEVQEIDGGEVGASIVKIVGSDPIMVHKAQ
ncbi:hypothetical protein AHAS_Ahas10G0058300 [Arachis hypogaea]